LSHDKKIISKSTKPKNDKKKSVTAFTAKKNAAKKNTEDPDGRENCAGHQTTRLFSRNFRQLWGPGV